MQLGPFLYLAPLAPSPLLCNHLSDQVLTESHREQVDAYPLYAASALAANAFVRCFLGGESKYLRDGLHGLAGARRNNHRWLI